MAQKIKIFLWGLLLVVGFLVGCSEQDGSKSSVHTIATFSRAIDYSPYYVARRFGWFESAFEAQGKEVNFREFSDRENIAAALENKSLTVLFAAAPPVIITRAQGVDVSIIELSATLQQEILVRPAIGASSPNDLRGLRIAVLPGTSSHYGVLNTLNSSGITEEDVTFVFQGPNEAQAAFEGGSVDAWAVWPPFVEEQELAGRGTVLEGGDAVIQSVVAAADWAVEQDPAVIQAVADAVRQAKAWILDNPDEAQVIVARELNIDPAIVERAWGKHDWAARITEDFSKDIANKVEFLRNVDAIRSSASPTLAEEIVNRDFGGSERLPR